MGRHLNLFLILPQSQSPGGGGSPTLLYLVHLYLVGVALSFPFLKTISGKLDKGCTKVFLS